MTTAGATSDLDLSRRSFVVALGGAVGELVLGLRLSPALHAQGGPASLLSPISFVQVGKDGVVTIVCSRSEMGQGIRSSLPFVLADELGADFARVRVVQGDADARYGDQNTDGSRSVRDFHDVMRVAGAADARRAGQEPRAARGRRRAGRPADRSRAGQCHLQPEWTAAARDPVQRRPARSRLAAGAERFSGCEQPSSGCLREFRHGGPGQVRAAGWTTVSADAAARKTPTPARLESDDGRTYTLARSGRRRRLTDTMRQARDSPGGQIGRYEVELPEGVTAADWGLERVRVQNPSIRSYLGCIRLLEEVLDSDYAILHCSPERLLKIWRRVEQVCQLMRSELLPTLEEPSVIPSLGDARRHAAASFQALAETVLVAMERYGDSLRADQLPEVRKLLCVSIGKVYAFLRDTFGEIVANDPRSRHDADYFLSKRFAQDIEESEWLYSAVYELDELLHGLEKAFSTQLADSLPRMRKERMIPPESGWEHTRKLLDILVADLIPKLKEVLSLRGIRVNDMESLEAHASSISTDCRLVLEVYAVGRDVIEKLKGVGAPTLDDREQRVEDLISCHRVISGRLTELLAKLQASLRDLAKQIADSKAGIENRRALMLTKDPVEFPPRTGRRVRGVR